MKTKRLFKENPYLVSSEAMILESLPFEDHTAVILDRTVFFPEGGGQPWDLGRLTIKTGSCRSYAVIKVIEHDGEILHVLDTSDDVPVNSVCLLELDWQRRFDSMQRHTGEHIFTGVFDKCEGVFEAGKFFNTSLNYYTLAINTDKFDFISEGETPVKKALTNSMIKEIMDKPLA